MKKLAFLMIIAAIFLLPSCSGSNVLSPDPGNTDNPILRPDLTSTPVYVSDWDNDGNPSAGMGALGLFEGVINPQAMQVT